ncbi:MAG: LapA family protein [Smithella sp.]
MNFKAGLLAILALLALIFLIQNMDVVTVKFLLWEMSMSRAVLIFFLLLIGFVAGWFLQSLLFYRKKKDVKNIKS